MNMELIEQVATLAGWTPGVSDTGITQYTVTAHQETPFPVNMLLLVQQYGANMFIVVTGTGELVPYGTGLDTLQTVRYLTMDVSS